MGLVSFLKEASERSLWHVLHGINSEKPATCGLGSRSSPDTEHASTFILDFLASWWREIRFLPCISPPPPRLLCDQPPRPWHLKEAGQSQVSFLLLRVSNVVLFSGLLCGETAQHCKWFALILGISQVSSTSLGLQMCFLKLPSLLLPTRCSFLSSSPAITSPSSRPFFSIPALLMTPSVFPASLLSFILNRPACVSRSGWKWLLLHYRASLHSPKPLMSASQQA